VEPVIGAGTAKQENIHMSDDPASAPDLSSRRRQAFPELTPEQIERMEPLGTRRRWADGELLFEAGRTGPGLFVVLK
jgi:thioredoxin reductase (NADPH)